MQYIREVIGGNSFDEKDEINHASKAAFKRLDSDKDGLIEPTDLSLFWQRQSRGLRTVDEVCDWIAHAVQLPQYVSAFRQNAVVGSDFPWLLEKKGAMLRDDIGISSELHRRQIMRGIRMVVLSIGTVGKAPLGLRVESQEQGRIQLIWDLVVDERTPVHKYELQRTNNSIVTEGRESLVWETVYYGREHACSILLPARESIKVEDLIGVYSYRVRSWNMVGPSGWSEPLQARPLQEMARQISTFLAVLGTVGAFFKFVSGPLEMMMDRFQAPMGGANRGAGGLEGTGEGDAAAVTSGVGDDFLAERELFLDAAGESGELLAAEELLSGLGNRKRVTGRHIRLTGKMREIDTGRPIASPGALSPSGFTTSPDSDDKSPLKEPTTPPLNPSLVKLRPVRTGNTPNSSKKRCEGCNAKFSFIKGVTRHQCRRCLLAKCDNCTNVGCFMSITCGDQCICAMCEEEEDRLRQRRAKERARDI